ncbi:MAG: glycosyltransferase family 4 protein [Candidatus Latescibacterota bacterium]|nr:glycosyltransferase family 4 protein [Candidatus Latescibacterota bacterium]
MSLRVLLFGTQFPPSAAGTASYTHALATGLSASGAQVRVLTQAPPSLTGPAPLPSDVAIPQTVTADDIDVQWIPYTTSAVRRYVRCRAALVQEIARFQPHCLWTTNGMGTRVAGLVSKLGAPRWPTISCVRGTDISSRLPGRTPARWLESVFHRRCYARSSAIAVVSRALCDVAVAKGLSAQRLFVSPPAFDLRKSASARAQAVRSPTTILTVARLQRQKRIDVLLRAMALVRQRHDAARLIVVGEGPQRDRLERMTFELHIDEHVDFVGSIEPRSAALYEQYERAGIFALPSVREGLGNVFIEAGAFGLPAIGCDDGGTPEVVVDGKTGLLVPPDDQHALAEALDRLLADAELRQQLGTQAHSHVEDHFSIESLGQASFEMVQRVVAGKDTVADVQPAAVPG